MRGILSLCAMTLLVALSFVATDRGNAQDRQPAESSSSPAVIQAGDRLDVAVFGHAELSRSIDVQPDGSISYPFIGRLVVTGKTVDSIARAIAGALETQYNVREPRVSVAISSFGARTVFILGRVRSPGSHPRPVSGSLRLLQLIALAGGLAEGADPSNVTVRNYHESMPVDRVLDLSELERTGFTQNDVVLEDGDTVYVQTLPPPGRISVLGQVNAPGSYELPPDVPPSVVNSIALARGFTRLADRTEVIWTRAARGAEGSVQLDVDAILNGKAEDLVVSPNDVLYVTERTW